MSKNPVKISLDPHLARIVGEALLQSQQAKTNKAIYVLGKKLTPVLRENMNKQTRKTQTIVDMCLALNLETLAEQLKDALIVEIDTKNSYFVAWYGGQITAFTPRGITIGYWGIDLPPCDPNVPSGWNKKHLDQVRKNIRRHIREGNYPN